MGDLGKMIKPSGHLLLLVSRPHWCNWVIWLKWRHKWFSEAQVRAMAEAVGLSMVKRLDLHSGPPSRTSYAYLISKVEPQ